MAVTAEAQRLARDHRRQQIRLRRTTAAELATIWRATFDVDNVIRSMDAVVLQAVPIIREQATTSARAAVDFYLSHRAASGVSGVFVPQRAQAPDPAHVQRALIGIGRIGTLKAIKAGKSPAQAARAGLTNTIGESTRLVGNAGRETITTAAQTDRQASGFERVTGGDPCEFCAMLAARGPAYASQRSGDFEAHRSCNCEAVPVYGKWEPSAKQREFRELYDRVAKGERDPLKTFRAAYRERNS